MTPKQRKELLVVPVIQKCFHDMSASTPEINRERDEKLDVFVDWGKRVINRLNGLGMWADVMDPASGYPIISPSGALPYPDVQGTIDLMGYETHNVGCCHILLHPKWRSKIYPSTFFTTAPADLLVKVIDEVLEKA
ncbi:methylmalonic aciduria and homocystinuria type D protein [Phycomyces nitens]|nr:methylmalonic aciduria and homocystinuria type D protein [Phycomyces nitens]